MKNIFMTQSERPYYFAIWFEKEKKGKEPKKEKCRYLNQSNHKKSIVKENQIDGKSFSSAFLWECQAANEENKIYCAEVNPLMLFSKIR